MARISVDLPAPFGPRMVAISPSPTDSETEQLAEIILQLPGRGIGVCLIDHDMNLIASICRRLVVLDFGTKIAEGPPGEVLNDKKVVEVYLGAPN